MAATAVALVVGGLAAFAVATPRAAWLDVVVMLPLGASAVMLGFGFVIAFDEPPLDLRSSPWLVPVAQALVASPFVVRIVAPALRSIDARLREAAAVLGAPPRRVWREIDLPLVLRALGVAAGFAFAISLGEFGATVFIARSDWPTVPVAIFRFLGRPGAVNAGQAAALAVVLMILTADRGARRGPDRRAAGDAVSALRVESVALSFDGVPALAGVDLALAEGERLAVLGPSGSGKSTLLRVIAGLERPDAGRVLIDDRDVRGRAGAPARNRADVPGRRPLPPPRRRGQRRLRAPDGGSPGAAARTTRVAEVLDLVGLAGYERRSVATLSGGERQRVALARALAPDPALLLLDEPLGSLDRPLRERLLADLESLFERLGRAVVVVTHDVGEAFALADRVAVVRAGRVVQAAAPDELWARPADAWTARFLGLANVRERDGRATVIRPEAVRVVPGDGATVLAADRRGPLVRLRVRRDDGEELEAVTTELDHPRPGDRVDVEIDPAGVVTLAR